MRALGAGGGRWAPLSGLLLAVALLAVGAPPAAAQALWSPAQDPLAGSRVFGARGCARCHAINGLGGGAGAGAPDLGRVPRPRSFYDLAASLWNHAPKMAERMRQLGIERPRLLPTEAANLVAFLFTLSYFDRPGRPDAGSRLFTEKRCIACHQLGGQGGVVGPALDTLPQYGSPIFLATAMWNHAPQMSAAMRARAIPRPSFTETELVDLIAHIRASSPLPAQGPIHVLPGRPEEGRRLFVEKRCRDCHGAEGQGPGTGPDLAERARQRSLIGFVAAMWNTAPAMLSGMQARGIPVPELAPEEMAHLVGYLYSVRYFALAGDPARGLATVTAKGCLACHSMRGEPGRPAGDLAPPEGFASPGAVLAGLWNHAFLASAGTREWREIQPQEMADVMALLQDRRR